MTLNVNVTVDEIRERAALLWDRRDRPEGYDVEFWRQAEREPPRAPTNVEEDTSLLAGPRRLTNRAFDALDQMGDWVLGRGRN